jgi:tetratricopeptide (TPR) repeat protein
MEFRGTSRFAVQKVIGTGGFGVVYQAFDRARQMPVALKTLRRLDPASLYRFKQEFRALSDISHPNLVTLYELVATGDDVFFTMELVEGRTILRYIREDVRRLPDPPSDVSHLGTVEFDARPANDTTKLGPGSPETGADIAPAPVMPGPRGVDVARLRHAFAQLAEGVLALHEGGLLHRDLKPSNVLVTDQGRVVILDFGLAQESLPEETRSNSMMGTPAYMSPEHASGLGTSEASDWYSVGVMLYEALTGQPPFTGSYLEVLVAKQRPDPPRPSQRARGVPSDLDALCDELLVPDPTKRPIGRDVLARLGGRSRDALPAGTTLTSARRGPMLVGRARHLGALDDAFQATRGGQGAIVFVRGRSGMGKTALVRRFLRDLRQRDARAVTLVGRCYERESVPYKALDTIVDATAQYLKQLPSADADVVLPRDVLALARLFPVLREIDIVAGGHHRAADIPDPQELRRRAFAALRELLTRLSDRSPLVLFIDDMQWGDLDSCALLADLLAPPDPPALLLIVAFRSDDERNPILQTFLTAMRRTHPGGLLRDLEVGELEPPDARELATMLLGGKNAAAAERIDAIARESGGSPFFVDALARYASVAPATGAGEMTIEHLIRARVAQLPDEARRLLDVVAVAAAPLGVRVAGAAAGLAADDSALVELLRGRRLIRSHGVTGPDEIEVYHDRIRETVVAALSPDALAAYHRRLATSLEASDAADPERLAHHFRHAGQLDKAGQYYAAAATSAADALAFDRAARLYSLAIDSAPGRADLQPLRVGRATALANAGRGADAASAYLEAASSAPQEDAYDLTRRAAEQFLVSGHIDEGLAVLRTVLESVDLKLASTPRRAILSGVAQRFLLAFRGLSFHERALSELTPQQLRQIDACWSVAVGLGMVDNARAGDFQARHVRLALRAGELYRVARAIAMEIAHRAIGGSRNRASTESLIRHAKHLADRVRHPHVTALVTLNEAVAQFLWGDYPASLASLAEAERVLKNECTGVAWELDTTYIFWAFCQTWTGDWAAMSRRLPGLVAEVEERGDKYAAAYMRLRSLHLIHLAADNVAKAREQEWLGIEGWSKQTFQIQHFSDLAARQEIDLYDDKPAAAWDRVGSIWPAFHRSLLTRIQSVWIQFLDLRARSAVALAASPEGRANAPMLLSSAEQDASRLEHERIRWATALARLTRATIAATKGECERAARLAGEADALLTAADMRLCAAAARRRRGQAIGGDEGRSVVALVDAWMAGNTIKNPARVAAMIAPGTWEAGA